MRYWAKIEKSEEKKAEKTSEISDISKFLEFLTWPKLRAKLDIPQGFNGIVVDLSLLI